MKAIARALRVSRSNLLERLRSNRSPRPEGCVREAKLRGETGTDAALLAAMREIVARRASYGYAA